MSKHVPEIVKIGLAQMDDIGLQAVIDHEGPMLLDGRVYDNETGHC